MSEKQIIENHTAVMPKIFCDGDESSHAHRYTLELPLEDSDYDGLFSAFKLDDRYRLQRGYDKYTLREMPLTTLTMRDVNEVVRFADAVIRDVVRRGVNQEFGDYTSKVDLAFKKSQIKAIYELLIDLYVAAELAEIRSL